MPRPWQSRPLRWFSTSLQSHPSKHSLVFFSQIFFKRVKISRLLASTIPNQTRSPGWDQGVHRAVLLDRSAYIHTCKLHQLNQINPIIKSNPTTKPTQTKPNQTKPDQNKHTLKFTSGLRGPVPCSSTTVSTCQTSHSSPWVRTSNRAELSSSSSSFK